MQLHSEVVGDVEAGWEVAGKVDFGALVGRCSPPPTRSNTGADDDGGRQNLPLEEVIGVDVVTTIE